MKTYESNEKKLFIFGEYRQSGFPGGLLCCTISVSSSFLLQYNSVFYYYAEREDHCWCPFLLKRDEKHSQQFARISAVELLLYSYLNNTQIHSSPTVITDRNKTSEKNSLESGAILIASIEKNGGKVRLNNYLSINKSVKQQLQFPSKHCYTSGSTRVYIGKNISLGRSVGLLHFFDQYESTFLRIKMYFSPSHFSRVLSPKIYRHHFTLTDSSVKLLLLFPRFQKKTGSQK